MHSRVRRVAIRGPQDRRRAWRTRLAAVAATRTAQGCGCEAGPARESFGDGDHQEPGGQGVVDRVDDDRAAGTRTRHSSATTPGRSVTCSSTSPATTTLAEPSRAGGARRRHRREPPRDVERWPTRTTSDRCRRACRSRCGPPAGRLRSRRRPGRSRRGRESHETASAPPPTSAAPRTRRRGATTPRPGRRTA